jgi:aryl-alcohol dehydrogenase-like predicted oxidoreductase
MVRLRQRKWKDGYCSRCSASGSLPETQPALRAAVMQKRTLGNTGITVSELGFGCQSLGGGLYHGGRRQALALVQSAVDAGITFFDTSDHYTLGRSEEYLGAALRGRRAQVVIATKVGTTYTRLARAALRVRPALRVLGPALRPFKLKLHHARAARRNFDFSAGYLRAACEASLRRLRTDCIDILQLHKPPPELLASEELHQTLETLRRDGLVRACGVACDSAGEGLQALERPEFSVVQLTVNLLDQEAVSGVLARASAQGVGVIARNPRAQGYLTAAFDDVTAETYARGDPEVLERQAHARAYLFLTEAGRSLAQAALRYALQVPGVSSVVPRILNVTQLTEALGALSCAPLRADELARIVAVSAGLRRTAPVVRYRG